MKNSKLVWTVGIFGGRRFGMFSSKAKAMEAIEHYADNSQNPYDICDMDAFRSEPVFDGSSFTVQIRDIKTGHYYNLQVLSHPLNNGALLICRKESIKS